MPLSIVIDSNEFAIGNYWQFDNLNCHVRSLVKYGCDYTVYGQTGLIGVERKSWQDYVRCVGKDWKRFLKQLWKLRRNKFRCVIVEGNIDDPIYHSRMNNGAVAAKTAMVAALRVPVIFAGTPNRAKMVCLEFFKHAVKLSHKEKKHG